MPAATATAGLALTLASFLGGLVLLGGSPTSSGPTFAPLQPRDEVHVIDHASFLDQTCARTNAHDFINIFGSFAAVPAALGSVLEFGCAEHSIYDALVTLQPRLSDNVTVVHSTCEVTCTVLPDVHVIKDFEDFQHLEEFDTVIAARVIDRSRDAFRVLSNIYTALRPGGTLIFYERVYVGMASTVSALARRHSTGVHYLSVSEPVMRILLDKMDIVFWSDANEYVVSGGRVFRDIAVVARKPAVVTSGDVPVPTMIEGKVTAVRPADKRYFLVWTTPKETFGPLRWLVLDTLFAKVPDAEVFVYANYLPDDMFANYTALGHTVHLVRYDERALFDGTPLWKWAANLDEWKAGPYFYSHYTDAFRLCVLWKYGGIYIDFDVLLMKELGPLRNSFGTENPVGTPPDGLWANLKYQLLERDNLNFAVANFDRGAPFLNFVMLRFVEGYDPHEWGVVGPDLVTAVAREWERLNPALVRRMPMVDDASLAQKLPLEGAITIYTDPIVFYPIGWTATIEAATEKAFRPHVLAEIRNRSWTVHIYTQMYKLASKPFSYEQGSLLGHLIHDTNQR